MIGSQINSLKSRKTLTEKNKEIKKLKNTVNNQDKIIEALKQEVSTLKQKIETITKLFANKLNNAYKAISKLLNIKDNTINLKEYKNKVNSINKKDEIKQER